MAEDLPLIIRKAKEGDILDILQIENVSFVSPWDEDTFISILNDTSCKSIVALIPSDVLAGYCFALEMRNMIHLLNLAVRPEYRKKGIGRCLVEEVISLAALSNRKSIFLEVRMSNDSAKCLYRAMGFHHVCTWERYYTDTGEDAEVMAKKLS